MTKTQIVLRVALAGGFGLLVGCKSVGPSSCLKALPAEVVQERAPLRAPLGLELPDTRSALKVPPLDTTAVPPVTARCLEDPPMLQPLADPKADEKAAKKAERKERRAKVQQNKRPGPRQFD